MNVPKIPPTPLQYDNPGPRRDLVLSPVPTLVAYLLVYAVLACVMFFAAPRLLAVYRDFKPELPLVTQWMFSFAQWFRGIGWLLLLPIPIVVPFWLTRVSTRAAQSGGAGIRKIAGLTSIVLLLIGGLICLSLLLPYISIMQTVSSPTQR